MASDPSKFPFAKITARKINPSSGPEEGFLNSFSAFPPPELPGSGSWVENFSFSSQPGFTRLPEHYVNVIRV
jgi:hypothetical protein